LKPGKNDWYLRVMLLAFKVRLHKTSRQSHTHRLVASFSWEFGKQAYGESYWPWSVEQHSSDIISSGPRFKVQNKHSENPRHKNARKVFKLDLVWNSVIRVYRSSLDAAQSFSW
jgi:hypothetical protein